MTPEEVILNLTQGITVTPTAVPIYVNPQLDYQFRKNLEEVRGKYANKWPDLPWLSANIRDYVPGVGSNGIAWAKYIKDAIALTLTDGRTYIARYMDFFPTNLHFVARPTAYRDGYYPKTVEDAYIIIVSMLFSSLKSSVVSSIKTYYFTDPELLQYPLIAKEYMYKIMAYAFTEIPLPPPVEPALPEVPQSAGPMTITEAAKKYWPYALAVGIGLLLALVVLKR